MNDFPLLRADRPPRSDAPRPCPIEAPCQARRSAPQPPRSREFSAMHRAFQPHGGFFGSDELAGRLRVQSDQPISRLARWIVSRSIVSISWQAGMLIPAFQFEPGDYSVRPCCGRVLAELSGVFDDWELALWFAAPNAWLDFAPPVAVIARDERAVLQAARADRFIARG